MRQFVAVILVKSDGSVLAQHRDNKPEILGSNTWGTVGGAKEETDIDLKNAGARELLEETGYKINPDNLKFLTEDIYTTERGKEVQRIIFWAPYDGIQKINCFEGQEIRFVKPKEFSELNFYTGHEAFLRKASDTTFGYRVEKK